MKLWTLELATEGLKPTTTWNIDFDSTEDSKEALEQLRKSSKEQGTNCRLPKSSRKTKAINEVDQAGVREKERSSRSKKA